ncbi:hypothetical protein BC936DRAFT_149380 [Jimgerdemannia flammicorona]|uniref:Uncharacterized protein n=1 Tax=Jimgerdemannia flammicorona TaxID=994334 RepID=A0A433D0X9_9FUNG|nr:hypothetical protein BC936DRAFT_149380 [Jimgerdemannia flammicorona]
MTCSTVDVAFLGSESRNDSPKTFRMQQLSQALQHLHRVLPSVAGNLGPETVTPEVMNYINKDDFMLSRSQLLSVNQS